MHRCKIIRKRYCITEYVNKFLSQDNLLLTNKAFCSERNVLYLRIYIEDELHLSVVKKQKQKYIIWENNFLNKAKINAVSTVAVSVYKF